MPFSQDWNRLRLGSGAPPSREILLEEPVDLNFKSLDDVFQIRAAKVNAHADLLEKPYLPSASVFGGMGSGRPWWGIEGQFCHAQGKKSIVGPAEETRFFINPFLLLGLDEGKAFIIRGVPCVPAFPRPLSLKWSAGESKAEVVYDITRFFRERARQPKETTAYDVLTLVDYNARDLGYEYIHADLARSQNIEPVPGSVLFKEAVQIKGVIHLGFSCGYPGGCNNGSPYEPDLRFRIKGLPAVVYCELWSQRPADPEQKPDFTFVLYLN